MHEIERLITPLVLADSLDLLASVVEGDGPSRRLAATILDESLPRARRDAAAWVQELHTWADTWALWAIARRAGALTLLYPFASAIAESYASTARRNGDLVLGTRFPFHDVPLVSGAAQLAVGLVALGVQPNLAGSLTAWVRAAQHPDGGWGDGDGPTDVLTTFVAADLLASLDPDFEPQATADVFARSQRMDGWWRACGPEATWLTVEIIEWIRRADEPFARRFSWPHVAITNRDRRTGLPYYGYLSDLARLYEAVPGIARAQVELAFIDLAGFGAFNNAHGMEMGDRVLRSFGQAIARIEGCIAIRDGGDEFIVMGPPTATGLRALMAAFRGDWAREFASTYGVEAVAPRVLTLGTTGGSIVEARNDLGRRIGQLKRELLVVGPDGVQVDLD